jgi:hypothetical protein
MAILMVARPTLLMEIKDAWQSPWRRRVRVVHIDEQRCRGSTCAIG